MILLVIDTQNGIIESEIYEREVFENNLCALIKSARENKIEVVYIRHEDEELVKGSNEFEIYHKFAPIGDERIFDKNYNSAFKKTGLREYLEEKNENVVMVVGLQTDYCIDGTIKGGFELGYDLIVPAFCNSTTENDFMTAENTYKYYNRSWNGRYAKTCTVDEAIKILESK